MSENSGWREHAFSFQLNITGSEGEGQNKEYTGTGVRVFYKVSSVDAEDTLPDFGSDIVYSGTTYKGIKAVSIQYEHEFIEQGSDVCENPKATVTYSSSAPEDDSDLPEGVGPEEAESDWQGETRTILLPGTPWVYYDTTTVGKIENYDVDNVVDIPVGEGIPIQTSTGTFNLTHDFNTFATFKSWVSSKFPSVSNKLNESTFYGFPVGTVLVNSFSKTYTQNKLGSWVHRVSLQLQWMLISNVSSDSWQKLPSPDGSDWMRVVLGERSPGAGTIEHVHQCLYEYTDFGNLFSTTP